MTTATARAGTSIPAVATSPGAGSSGQVAALSMVADATRLPVGSTVRLRARAAVA